MILLANWLGKHTYSRAGSPRASPYNGLRAADDGGPYVDERLFRAENTVAGIA